MRKFYFMLGVALLASVPALAQKMALRRASITLPAPTVQEATDITSNAFTANWMPVDGADGYCVYVYIKDIAATDGEYVLADEDFNGIDVGSLITPAGGEEYGVDLSAYGYALSYGWEAYAYPTFAPSLVAGLLYSPYLYLVNNDGNYKINLTTYSNQNDQIRVESHGIGDKVVEIYTVELDNSQATGIYTKTLEMNNGSRDLFFSAINVSAPMGQADYIDRVQVTQDLLAGDVVYTNIAADEAVDAEDDWGYPVTSTRFTLPAAYLNGHTEVYYDVYAAAYDFSTPNGSVPYTLVASPYSQRVLVDLRNRTSEVVDDDITAIADVDAATRDNADDAWYDMTGRRITNPTTGIYIHGGKKVIVK